jgi:hypothetical protein
MRRLNIHAAGRGAARVQPSLNITQSFQRKKYETLNIHAVTSGAARVRPA